LKEAKSASAGKKPGSVGISIPLSVRASFKNAIVQSSIMLGFFLGVNKLFGFAEKILIANYFGTSSEADVFIVVQGMFITGWVFVEEIVSPALIPVLSSIGKNAESDQRARLVRWILVILAPAIILGLMASVILQKQIGQLLYPGLDESSKEMVRNLWLYFCVAALPYFLTPILQAYANANKRFFAPAFSAAIGRTCMIVVFIMAVRSTGLMGAGIGMVVYACVYFGLLFFLVRIPLRRLSESVSNRILHQKNVAQLALPLLIGFVFSQACQWIDVRYGSQLAKGTLSGLAFSKKLIDVPVLLLSFCVGTVLLPYLSGFAADGNIRSFKRYVNRSMILCFIAYGLGLLLFLIGAEQIVKMVYARGRFDAASIAVTAGLLKYYAPGLLVFSCEIIVMQASFAVRNHWTAIIVGMICASLNMTATILLVPQFGAMVIPLAVVGQKGLKTAILWLFLRKKLSAIEAIRAS
jgi:putative peptidoglycan lipid II flippase